MAPPAAPAPPASDGAPWLDLGHRPGEQPNHRQALGEPVGIAIEPQRRLERGKPDLVDPQRALHGVLVDRRDQLLARRR